MRRYITVSLVAVALATLVGGAVVAATLDTEQKPAAPLTVPQATETDIVHAYDLVRAAGFRVGIRNEFSITSLCLPIAEEQLPPFGAPMAQGAVVALTAGFCPMGSPVVQNPMRTAAVPNFKGELASDVVSWAERSGMFWTVRDAPAIVAGAAPHLLDNYRVIRQSPRAGATLRPLVMLKILGARGFRPTPITVWVETV